MTEAEKRELDRAYRVADMSVTAHSALRDKYSRRAFALDMLIFVASILLVATAFIDPAFSENLSVYGLSDRLVIGGLAVLTFITSIFQLLTDWKALSAQHGAASEGFAHAKFALSKVLRLEIPTDEERLEVLDLYRAAGESHLPIPEDQFIRLKRRHKIKVRISKELDQYPSAWIWLIRLRYLAVDTFYFLRSSKKEHS